MGRMHPSVYSIIVSRGGDAGSDLDRLIAALNNEMSQR